MDPDENIHRQSSLLEHTTSSLNNTNEFLGDDQVGGGHAFDEEQILDEPTRELLKFGFKKVAKNADFILIDDLGDAFRHAGQNPSNDVVKDIVEKARALKKTNQTDADDEQSIEQLSYPDYLTVVHEYWFPYDEDRQELEEAFDTLDPKRTAKLGVEDFTTLLRNCDWAEEDIELMMAQVSCGDGYFLYDDLSKLLLTPVELPKKKSGKPKSSGKKKAAK